jgi:hypothetical protein
MYEYAASGIPVLATGIPEVRMISESLDGVYVASTTEEFQKNLETALQLSESDRLHLREWSQNQSWKSRSVELLQSIEDNPKVSVIVLMWNQGLLTLNCLKSVYERSDYKNLEVILVDNGSDMEESAIVTSWIENYNSGRPSMLGIKRISALLQEIMSVSRLQQETLWLCSTTILKLLPDGSGDQLSTSQ